MGGKGGSVLGWRSEVFRPRGNQVRPGAGSAWFPPHLKHLVPPRAAAASLTPGHTYQHTLLSPLLSTCIICAAMVCSSGPN